MNVRRKALKGRGISTGKLETVLYESNEPKIAVLELSTRAVKLLIGDKEALLKNGFHFDYFKKKSYLTHTGNGLTSKNIMNIEFFKEKVLPQINKCVNKAKEEGVTVVYAAATAAYRDAKNRDEIIRIIKYACGINIKVLSREEEGKSAIKAFMFSSNYDFYTGRTVVSIDQGGGSTEVLVLCNSKIIKNYFLSFGTTKLINRFLFNLKSNIPLKEGIEYMDKLIELEVKNSIVKIPYFKSNPICISFGGVITKATGLRSNKWQHGKTLTVEYINDKMKEIEEELLEKFTLIREVKNSMLNIDNMDSYVENLISLRIGLKTYLEIMKKFNVDETIVSGAGVWYGIYYDGMKRYYLNGK